MKFQTLQGASARKVLLLVGIMTAHALGEGSGVGVSFCGRRGWAQVEILFSVPYFVNKVLLSCHAPMMVSLYGPPQGLLVTVAIGLHNVPEGLATATVLVARGIPAHHAFWWTLFTSLPQPLLALPSFVFVDAFSALLPLALGFAAGCMVWMVFAELLPDALADAPHSQVRMSICYTCFAGGFPFCTFSITPWQALLTSESRLLVVQVATAATMSAAGLEAMRMALFMLEQNATMPRMDVANLLLAGKVMLASMPGILAGEACLSPGSQPAQHRTSRCGCLKALMCCLAQGQQS